MTTEPRQRRALVLIKTDAVSPFAKARQDAAERATLSLCANMLETSAAAVGRAHKLLSACIGSDAAGREIPKREARKVLDMVMADLQAVMEEL